MGGRVDGKEGWVEEKVGGWVRGSFVLPFLYIQGWDEPPLLSSLVSRVVVVATWGERKVGGWVGG